jgi:phosphoribosylpyrophosphate synthetase
MAGIAGRRLEVAHIRRDHRQVRDLLIPEVPAQHQFPGQMIHRDVEEPLQLVGVQVDREDPVGPGGRNKIGHQLGRDRHAAFVFAVLAGELIGSVEGCNVLMCDDIIATAGTICTAAELVKQRGAKHVLVGVTHGVFAPPALERLAKAPIDEVVVTNTIPLTAEAKEIKKIKVLSVAVMLGEAIKRIHRDESVSALFGQEVL